MKKLITFRTIAFACALAALATLTHAAPRSVRVTYNGYMGSLPIGTSTEQFESDGASYRIVSDTRPMSRCPRETRWSIA